MERTTQILQDIMDRLDQSSSDPKWLNDQLAELKQAMADGPKADIPTFADMAALSAFGGLMQNFNSSQLPNTAEQYSAELTRIARLAVSAGQRLADLRSEPSGEASA